MSTSGETADLMVRESIQITESAVKLAALGAKNLAALLLALANDNQKIAGKTTLRKLLQSGDEIALFSINEKDLKDFQEEGKKYGFLYCPIINKAEQTGTVEIMARSRDVKVINRVLEKMGYMPEEKKQMPRNLSEVSLNMQVDGADRTMGKTAIEQVEERQSVKEKLQLLKSQSEAKEQLQKETAKGIKRREQVK